LYAGALNTVEVRISTYARVSMPALPMSATASPSASMAEASRKFPLSLTRFAAAGSVVYRKAKEAGLGHDLPTDWFTEDVHP